MADAAASQPLLVLTTEADSARAEGLARRVLEARLAACVSLRPLQSLYHWQGAIETAAEVQLLFKTDSRRLSALENLVHALHSYRTPEWIHWPVAADSAYGQWLEEELSPDVAGPDPEDPPGDGDPAG